MDISVVGLGKLGSPMAACLAAKGHQVVGVDLNEKFVQAINAGKPPVFEPGLQEMLDQTGGRLRATADCEQAISQTELTFLIVPTPSLPNGVFSLKYVLDAAQTIGRALRHKDTYHVVVLTSTVMPGATGAELVPALEKASGKRCPEDFGVCYSPEFISLGSVIRDYLHPDFVLIGVGLRGATWPRSVVVPFPVARPTGGNSPVSEVRRCSVSRARRRRTSIVKTSLGSHGFLARSAQMNALCVVAGRGIRPGSSVREAENIDVAPTAARLLGLDNFPADGRPLEGLLQIMTLQPSPDWVASYVRFEMVLLEDLGYGLDLEACAVTGAREGLSFVSPKSGRAVTREGAGAYANRLLSLPPFLFDAAHVATVAELVAGLALTEHFLARVLADAHGQELPPSRRRFAERVGQLA